MALSQNVREILLGKDGAGDKDTNFHLPQTRGMFVLYRSIRDFETCESSLEFLQGDFYLFVQSKSHLPSGLPVTASEAHADTPFPGSGSSFSNSYEQWGNGRGWFSKNYSCARQPKLQGRLEMFYGLE